MKIGFQPVSLTAQSYGSAVHPAGAPAWTTLLQIAFFVSQANQGAAKKMLLEKKLKEMDQEQPPGK